MISFAVASVEGESGGDFEVSGISTRAIKGLDVRQGFAASYSGRLVREGMG